MRYQPLGNLNGSVVNYCTEWMTPLTGAPLSWHPLQSSLVTTTGGCLLFRTRALLIIVTVVTEGEKYLQLGRNLIRCRKFAILINER